MTNKQPMSTDEALEVVRRFYVGYAAATDGERAALVLAAELIALREAQTEAVAAWRMSRDNSHVPAALRAKLDAWAERSS